MDQQSESNFFMAPAIGLIVGNLLGEKIRKRVVVGLFPHSALTWH
jgi:hypothetical protein